MSRHIPSHWLHRQCNERIRSESHCTTEHMTRFLHMSRSCANVWITVKDIFVSSMTFPAYFRPWPFLPLLLRDVVGGGSCEMILKGALPLMMCWYSFKFPRENVSFLLHNMLITKGRNQSFLTEYEKCDNEIWNHFGIAENAFKKQSKIWRNGKISLETNKRVENCYVISVLRYGNECWRISYRMKKRLEASLIWCYRKMTVRACSSTINVE